MTLEEVADLLGGPGATSEAIDGFEALVGLPLPDDYRRFLARTRGGRLPDEADTFRGEDGQHGDLIAEIHGLADDGDCGLVNEVRRPSWGRLALGLIQIADDAGGNPIALCLRPDRLGEVFLIDHEVMPFDGDDEDGADREHTLEEAEAYGSTLPLASSFTAFVTHLGSSSDS